MKKITLTLLALVCALCCVFGLAACGVGGTYKFESITMTVDGKEITAQAGEYFEIAKEGYITKGYQYEKDNLTVRLRSDGTCTITSYMGDLLGGSSIFNGTWEEVDGKVNIKKDDKITATYTIDGKTLIMEADGMKIVLKK